MKEFIHAGHEVVVETNAGDYIHATDAEYKAVGAEIVATAAEAFERADMIIKVKEPQAEECAMLREGQVLFTYLHLAADKKQAEGLINSGCTAIAYETVTSDKGGLPLLAPMSEVAGRMSVQVGAVAMQIGNRGGSGILMAASLALPLRMSRLLAVAFLEHMPQKWLWVWAQMSQFWKNHSTVFASLKICSAPAQIFCIRPKQVLNIIF